MLFYITDFEFEKPLLNTGQVAEDTINYSKN